MNISKSLKVKNRLAGKLKELETRAQKNNCTKEGQESSINLEELWSEIHSVRAELISLKSAIALATARISPKLVELAERKSEIKFYEGIVISEGNSCDYDGDKIVAVKNINHINESVKNEAISRLQKLIDILQDQIDDYNASTSV